MHQKENLCGPTLSTLSTSNEPKWIPYFQLEARYNKLYSHQIYIFGMTTSFKLKKENKKKKKKKKKQSYNVE